MPLSRLRLRLAAWFGAAFVLGLLILDVGFLGYSKRKAQAKFTRDLTSAALELRESIHLERSSRPESPVDSAVHAVVLDWPEAPDVIAIFDASGRRIDARGPSALLGGVTPAILRDDLTGTIDIPVDEERHLRIAWARDSTSAPLLVVVGGSTAGVQEEEENLFGWLLLSLPIIGLGAAASGYALARRALLPVQEMARALDAVDPGRLDGRLRVGSPPDELDQLAGRFNALLDRLSLAREKNRKFLGEAAHQLRTPLTIVRGESGLGPDRLRTPEEYRTALRRVNLAADQMARRVDDLFLLAEAEAGERPVLIRGVELDGVVLAAADLMRGRASVLERALAFGVVEDVTVTGAEPLLQEAVVELLENACRHGTGEQPVGIGVRRDGDRAVVAVTSAGPAIPEGPGRGLGLGVVRWVAEIHGGSVVISRTGIVNEVRIELPAEAGALSPGGT